MGRECCIHIVGVFKPVHIIGDDNPGVVPLDNEVGVEGDREVFVGHLRFQDHLRFKRRVELQGVCLVSFPNPLAVESQVLRDGCWLTVGF